MALTCSICSHPERHAIDTALLNSVPSRTIAQQYGVGATAVFRHKKAGHIAGALLEGKQIEKQQSADFIMSELVKLRKTAQRIVDESMKEKPAVAVGALRELRGLLTLHAELEGRLLKRREVTVTGTLTLAADQAVAYARALQLFTADFLRLHAPELLQRYLEGVPDQNSVRPKRAGGGYNYDDAGNRLLAPATGGPVDGGQGPFGAASPSFRDDER